MKRASMLMEFDKAGAEWVATAYISGDGRMIDVVESGDSPHVRTGMLISGADADLVEKESKFIGHNSDPDTIERLRNQHVPEIYDLDLFLPRTMSIRQAGKKSNHGLNYDMGYKRFALENEMDERDAKRIVTLYLHTAYPGISAWHEGVQRQLQDNRTLINCFGRKRKFRDAWGDDLFKAAYAFLPSSTVVDMVNQGMADAYYDDSWAFEDFDLLAQTHDSTTNQFPAGQWRRQAEFSIKYGLEYMSPVVQYGGREFQIKTDLKVGTHWGEGMIEVPLIDDVDALALSLEAAWDQLNVAET
jgi:hypothetical protein